MAFSSPTPPVNPAPQPNTSERSGVPTATSTASIEAEVDASMAPSPAPGEATPMAPASISGETSDPRRVSFSPWWTRGMKALHYSLLDPLIPLLLWKIRTGLSRGQRSQRTELGSQALMWFLIYCSRRETSSRFPLISISPAPHLRIGPIAWT